MSEKQGGESIRKDDGSVAAMLSGIAEGKIKDALQKLIEGFDQLNAQNDRLIQLLESKDARINDLRMVIGEKNQQIEKLLLEIEYAATAGDEREN